MEILFVVIFVVGSLLVHAKINTSRQEKLQRVWEEMATRHGGVFVPTHEHDVGTLIIEKNGQRFEIDHRVDGSGPDAVRHTRIRTRVAQPFMLTIEITNLPDRLLDSMLGDPITTGIGDYDAHFRVRGTHELWTRQVLANAESWRAYQLQMLRRRGERKVTSLELNEGVLVIEILRGFDSVHDFDLFFGQAVSVAHLLGTTPTPSLGYEAQGRISLAESATEDGALTISDAASGDLTLADD